MQIFLRHLHSNKRKVGTPNSGSKPEQTTNRLHCVEVAITSDPAKVLAWLGPLNCRGLEHHGGTLIPDSIPETDYLSTRDIWERSGW